MLIELINLSIQSTIKFSNFSIILFTKCLTTKYMTGVNLKYINYSIMIHKSNTKFCSFFIQHKYKNHTFRLT